MRTRFEELLAALSARDNLPSDPEQKNMVKAEFLRGAAMAFALCWRGEDSVQCLAAAEALHDRPQAPAGGVSRPGGPNPTAATRKAALGRP